MPPLAKNLVHEAATGQFCVSGSRVPEVLTVYFYQDTSHLAVRFNSHVDPEMAGRGKLFPGSGITNSDAAMSPEPDTVILTVSAR